MEKKNGDGEPNDFGDGAFELINDDDIEAFNQDGELKTVKESTDFIPNASAVSTKCGKIKQRSIYSKNTLKTLSALKWLPGDLLILNPNNQETSQVIYDKFRQSVQDHKLVSMMIYAVVEPSYHIVALSFSTPLLTVFLDFRPMVEMRKALVLPKEILTVVAQSDVKIICPGEFDWFYTFEYNHLSLLSDLSEEGFGFLKNIIYLDSYFTKLHILDSGKELCKHLKLVYWLFQVKFDSQKHGFTMPQNLDTTWRNMVDFYGKLLTYLYLALQEKEVMFNRNPKNGVDLNPIYLEDLLVRQGLAPAGMNKAELRKKLINK